MFTQCPDCKRQFRIRADQLTVAAGEVKCGYCGSQFNALLSLRDQPLPPEPDVKDQETVTIDDDVAEVGPRLGETEIDAEPQFILPPEADELQIDNNETAVARPLETDPVLEQQAEDAALETVKEVAEVPTPDIKVKQTHKKAAGQHYDFPEDYLKDEEQRPGRKSRVMWGLGCILLMLVLILQAGWFFRDRVLMQYPQLTPYVKQLCDRLQCRITRYRYLSGIRLVNRDVRDHPRYEGSLLVNATMINGSEHLQPFPLIRLSLFDTNGKVISWRQFTPREYLDDSIDIELGMVVNMPVHFVLEVTGPTQGAVSFEFDFLDG